jgi:putative CocE/NonD family hydrolase
MKNSHYLLFVLFSILIFPGISAQDITGDWYSLLNLEKFSLRLNLHIQYENNKLKATIKSPDYKAYHINIDQADFENGTLSFQIYSLKVSYEGEVNQNFTQIQGDFVQYGQSIPSDFRRRPVLIPKSSPNYIRRYYRKKEVYIGMRDGIRLFTSIYSPKDKKQTYPILIMRTPYNSEPGGKRDFNFFMGAYTEFVEEGYIMVFQDVRGTYMSEGEFVDLRPFNPDKKTSQDIDENTDTWDAIDWLIKNVPGNNGRVGIYGSSYPGFYATMSLPDAHPALKAVSPQAPITDSFIGDDDHHNGAFFIMDAFTFYSSYGWPRPEPTRKNHTEFSWPNRDNYKFFLDMGPVKNASEKYFGDSLKFWNEIMDHPDYDDFWKSMNPVKYLKNIKPAVFTIGGWFDAEDLYGTLHTYKAIENQNPSGISNRIMMGPWSHGQWIYGSGDQVGNIHWGTSTSDYSKEKILQFFNYYLKDKGSMDLPEASIFISGENRWKEFETWPPENINRTDLYFQKSGSLSFNAPQYPESFDEYVSDPMKPVPYTQEVHLRRTTSYMTDDQRFASRRPDVMVYETGDLQEDFTFTGPVIADLFVSTTGTDADWVVKLIDEFPDTLGNYPDNEKDIPMQGYQMLVRGEVMRGRFRNSFENPEPFIPGNITEVKFTIPDIAHTFKKGHRIIIQVQNSWFPLVDRNPQKFVDIYHCNEEDFQKATNRIYHDEDYPSHITLWKLNE